MEEKDLRAYDRATREHKNNAKCPFCGEELYVGLKKGNGICTKCKKQFDNEKAIKLFESIHEEEKQDDLKKTLSGEEYLELDRILQRAEFYFKKKDYENAKKELDDAYKITNNDYRVYFGYVRVETKDLTDYRNESHKQYLDKAVEVADKDEKAVIMKLYKDFYQLSKLPDEDILQYKKEENIAIKDHLEEKLKELIPFYMKKESKIKIDLVLFPIFIVIGIALGVVSFIVNMAWLLALGACVIFGGYFFIRDYVLSKRVIKLFNAYLDFYDALDGFDFNEKWQREVLDAMKICRECFSEKNNSNKIEESIYDLMKVVLDSYNGKATEFVQNHKVLSPYANAFEEV